MGKIDELTVEQLDRLTAEHVMGLDMESINDNYMVLFEGEVWQPTLNGNQALLLFERAEEKLTHSCLILESGWTISKFYGHDEWETLSSAETPHIAICRAALKVVGYDPD